MTREYVGVTAFNKYFRIISDKQWSRTVWDPWLEMEQSASSWLAMRHGEIFLPKVSARAFIRNI